MTYKEESLNTDMFDNKFSLLTRASYMDKNNEEFSLAGFDVTMKRSHTPFYMNVYLPTALLTITSLIGFLIPPDIVPGRMALLVTIFLMIVNISITERNRGPRVIYCTKVLSLTCLMLCYIKLRPGQ